MDLLALHILNAIYATESLALVVLGLAVVFGWLGVMNMAHGEFVMLGAYSAVVAQQLGWRPLAALPLALLVSAVAGAAIEWAVIRRLYRRPFDTLLATWGLSILMRKCVELGFGREYRSLDQTLSGSLSVLGVPYPAYRVWLMAAILVLFACLFVWYRVSQTGARVKAMISNPELAASLGINTAALARAAFVFGAASAGLAGALLAPLVRVEPFMGIDYLLFSFFALVVGGLGSFAGLGIGAGIVGGGNSLVAAWLGSTGGHVTVLLVSILFLWLKPNGLYSRR
jgi:urea ABC transporter permease protein UrtB